MPIRLAAIALACCAGLGSAIAQSGSLVDADLAPQPPTGLDTMRPGALLQLSAEQRKAAFAAVRQNKTARPMPDLQVSVGAPVPPTSELHSLPESTVAPNPHLSIYKYTVIDDRLLLVDPTDMRIVAVIDR
jgi:hypothetical protein